MAMCKKGVGSLWVKDQGTYTHTYIHTYIHTYTQKQNHKQAEVIAMCKKGVETLWVKDQGNGFKFEDATFPPDLKSIFIDPKKPTINLSLWNTTADQVRVDIHTYIHTYIHV
jgi:hypothetical protein